MAPKGPRAGAGGPLGRSAKPFGRAGDWGSGERSRVGRDTDGGLFWAMIKTVAAKRPRFPVPSSTANIFRPSLRGGGQFFARVHEPIPLQLILPVGNVTVAATGDEQLLMPASLHDAAPLEYQDLISGGDR